MTDNPYRAPEEICEPPQMIDETIDVQLGPFVVVAWCSLALSIIAFLVVTAILMQRRL